MVERKYKSAVVVPKLYKLWKKLPYKKSPVIKEFVKKENPLKYLNDYEELKEIPIRKRTVLAPKGINREELIGFVGFLFNRLKKNNGNIEKTMKEIESLWQ